MPMLMASMRKLALTLGKDLLRTEDYLHLEENGISMNVTRVAPGHRRQFSVQNKGVDVKGFSANGEELILEVTLLEQNPFDFENSGDDVTTGVVSINMWNMQYKEIAIKDGFDNVSVTLQHAPLKTVDVPVEPSNDQQVVSGDTHTSYHSVQFDNPGNGLGIGFRNPEKNPVVFQVFYKLNGLPEPEDFDFSTTKLVLPGQTGFALLASEGIGETGYGFVGLQIYRLGKVTTARKKRSVEDIPDSLALSKEDNKTLTKIYGLDIPWIYGSSSVPSNYSVTFVSMGCRVWSETEHQWRPNSCKAETPVDAASIGCSCKDPPGFNFAASVMVSPNMIDFKVVFSQFDPKNALVLATVLVLFLLFIPLAVWARKRDKRDVLAWGVTELSDNQPGDNYFYIISVHTGLLRGGSTQARMGFVLAGDKSDTGIRELGDGVRKEFKRGSIVHFLLATPTNLGTPLYLRVWHDCSGPGSSWYLDKILLSDVQTKESFYFPCGEWLAADRGDHEVTRLLPAVLSEPPLGINEIFFDNARLLMTEEHLWISIIIRTTKTYFSRLQRLGCAFSLLFLTMISSAMFFGKGGTEERPMGVRVGPINFTLSQVYISVLSIIIVTPFGLLVIQMFKKSKPQTEGSPRNAKSIQDCHCLCGSRGANPKEETLMKMMLTNYVVDSRKNCWPYWVAYIAWVLVWLAILSSGFFLILYSQDWGSEKSKEWLVAFLLSFFEDLAAFGPIKVIVLAVLLAIVLRKPAAAERNQTVNSISNELQTDEEWEEETKRVPHNTQSVSPLAPDALRRIIKELRKRKIMSSFVRDTLLYLVVVVAVWSVGYDQRDPRSFRVTGLLGNLMLQRSSQAAYQKGFINIKNTSDFYNWLNNTFMPAFFAEKDYANNRLPWRKRMFMLDGNNYRVGAARMRLLRMHHKDTKLVKNLIDRNIVPAYDLLSHDQGDYCIGWQPPPCDRAESMINYTSKAWRFASAAKTGASPQWAERRFYDGSGYVSDLDINQDVTKVILKELFVSNWIDVHTRAIFLDFTLYNANVNLHTVVTLTLEYLETGGILPHVVIRTFRVYFTNGPTGLFVFICELIYLLVILGLTYREGVALYRQKLKYFSKGWQLLDFCIIVLGYVSVAMFASRYLVMTQRMNLFKRDPTQFINMHTVAEWDSFLGAVLALVIFFLTVRFLRILNVSKRVATFVNVMSIARADFISFFVIFLLFFTNFAAVGYLLFGSEVEEYRSVLRAMGELLSTMLGKNHFSDMLQANSSLAGIFFLLFNFSFVIILINLLVAIIMDSIDETHKAMKRNREEILKQLLDRMKAWIRKSTAQYKFKKS